MPVSTGLKSQSLPHLLQNFVGQNLAAKLWYRQSRIARESAPIIPFPIVENGWERVQNQVRWGEMFVSQFHGWLSFLVALSSGVKIGLFLLSWMILWLPLAWLLGKKIQWQPFQPLSATQKLPLLVPLYLIVPFLVWLTIIVEGDSWSDYGLEWQPILFLSLLLGMGLGIGGLGIVFGLEGRFGWLEWHSENLSRLGTVSLPILGLALWVGITEELVFRGVFVNLLQQDYASWVAAIASSGIFALLHLLWERKETIPQLPGLWLMGIVLVGARWVDGGSLGLAWGLHAGWIWGLSSLDAAELISYTGKSADWIVGIGKQPLAGMAGILCLLATGWVLWQFEALRLLDLIPYTIP